MSNFLKRDKPEILENDVREFLLRSKIYPLKAETPSKKGISSTNLKMDKLIIENQHRYLVLVMGCLVIFSW